MSGLGSIYEADDGSLKGRDLRYAVSLRRDALDGPVEVEVPLELPLGDERVARAVGPGESGALLTLNLPADVPSGATLRLRGQGEDIEDGRPGDLYLSVTVTEKPGPQAPYGGWLVAGAVVVLGVLAWVLIK